MEKSTFSEMPARNFRWFPVVVNVAHFRMRDNGPPEAIPYALTLIPASKRGSVDERGIDVIAKLTSRRLARKPSLAMRGWILFLVNGGSLAHSQC